jgi:hypothetical protein
MNRTAVHVPHLNGSARNHGTRQMGDGPRDGTSIALSQKKRARQPEAQDQDGQAAIQQTSLHKVSWRMYGVSIVGNPFQLRVRICKKLTCGSDAITS